MKPLRSILFVPGDSEKKIARSLSCGADALVLDLEDSVSAPRKPQARELTAARLAARTAADPELWVRINPLDTPDALQDLKAITAGRPDVIVLPKASSAADVLQLHHYLHAFEVAAGIPAGQIKIVCVATETAASIFHLGSYSPATPRLAGLTWGAEDLAAAIGAFSNSDEHGLTPLYRMARALCLAAAANAGVTPIDTACMQIRDLDMIARECSAGKRDGFRAKLAIHPDQVPIINRTFSPNESEIAEARAIVAAYTADPNLGTFQLGNKMIDIPHLKQAEKILALAAKED
jgi:citrate lyase subunit beta/citryl-CoA lyase